MWRADKNSARNEIDLDSASSSAAWLSCSVVRYRSHVVDPTNAKACSRKCPDSSLSAGTWNSWTYSTDSTYANMQGIDALCLGRFSCCYSRFHGCVGRRFITVSGNVASARAKRDRLASTQIGYMDKRVIVTTKNVSYPPLCLGNIACCLRHALEPCSYRELKTL